MVCCILLCKYGCYYYYNTIAEGGALLDWKLGQRDVLPPSVHQLIGQTQSIYRILKLNNPLKWTCKPAKKTFKLHRYPKTTSAWADQSQGTANSQTGLEFQEFSELSFCWAEKTGEIPRIKGGRPNKLYSHVKLSLGIEPETTKACVKYRNTPIQSKQNHAKTMNQQWNGSQ